MLNEPEYFIQPVEPGALLRAVNTYRTAAAQQADPAGVFRWVRGAEQMACLLLEAGCRREDGTQLRNAESWRCWAHAKKSRRMRAHDLVREVWRVTLENYPASTREQLESALRMDNLLRLMEAEAARLKLPPFGPSATLPAGPVAPMRLH